MEDVVEFHDLPPVGGLSVGCDAVERGDAGLDGEGAGAVAEGCFDEGDGCGDLGVVPAGAILVFEGYEFAGFVACVALLANLVLTVAFMVLVNATFTLVAFKYHE